MFGQVTGEVLLGSELELQLLGGDVDEAALLGLGDRVGLHIKFVV